MSKRSTVLAAAAAALFTAGVAGGAVAAHHESGEEMVKCQGVNSCKGHSDCQTDHSDCKGHNDCSGKGWVNMSKEDCDKAKAAKES